MNIYWGNSDSGKAHLRKYATINNKCFSVFKQYQIIKRKFECKEFDYDINERLWWHIIKNTTVYHKRKDENDIRISKFMNETVGPLLTFKQQGNYTNPDYGTEADRKWEMNNYGMFKSEQFVKYTSKEYIDTAIYNMMIQSNNVGHACDKIVDHKDKFDINEIAKDIDLLFLFVHVNNDANFTDEIIHYANHFRNEKHIVPYKEDLVDSVAGKLDKMGHNGWELVGENMMETYNNDKEKLWRMIDKYFEYDANTIKMLESNNIDYVKFNLDRDDYVETFGWKIHPFSKYKLTHQSNTFFKQEHFDRWQVCIRLAKEYLSDRKR